MDDIYKYLGQVKPPFRQMDFDEVFLLYVICFEK